MDTDLRCRLWNVLELFIWSKLKNEITIDNNIEIKNLLYSLYIDFFKRPIDTLSIISREIHSKIRTYYFDCEWMDVYDFIEFIANNYPFNEEINNSKNFIEACNIAFEKEVSAYRFVGYMLTEITSHEEIKEIEKALQIPFEGVNKHLNRALKHLSDRKNPDYRNSMKESISAVESICKLIAKKDKATLGDALTEIEKNKTIELHPALKSAFSKLYGYTNDADGIRHALLKKENLNSEDARYMLISCSAFINYLKIKADKAKITFK